MYGLAKEIGSCRNEIWLLQNDQNEWNAHWCPCCRPRIWNIEPCFINKWTNANHDGLKFNTTQILLGEQKMMRCHFKIGEIEAALWIEWKHELHLVQQAETQHGFGTNTEFRLFKFVSSITSSFLYPVIIVFLNCFSQFRHALKLFEFVNITVYILVMLLSNFSFKRWYSLLVPVLDL